MIRPSEKLAKINEHFSATFYILSELTVVEDEVVIHQTKPNML